MPHYSPDELIESAARSPDFAYARLGTGSDVAWIYHRKKETLSGVVIAACGTRDKVTAAVTRYHEDYKIYKSKPVFNPC